MGIREFYQNLKETIKCLFGIRTYLKGEQRDYVLSGIDSEILKNYRVTYSPNGFYFKADENGTKLEKGLEKTLAQSKREIRRNFNENIKKIELDYLRKLAELSSSTLEAYNKANDGLRNILIKNRCDGRLVVKFR